MKAINSNKEFYEKIATALSKKGILTTTEIKAIKETCTVIPVAL